MRWQEKLSRVGGCAMHQVAGGVIKQGRKCALAHKVTGN